MTPTLDIGVIKWIDSVFIFKRCCPAGLHLGEICGSCPFNCVFDNLQHVLVVINGVGFVAGLEIEDLSSALLLAAARSEYLTARIP